jgi:hypothetical protein
MPRPNQSVRSTNHERLLRKEPGAFAPQRNSEVLKKIEQEAANERPLTRMYLTEK